MAEWPRGPKKWMVNGEMFISIPFTWNLPRVKRFLLSGDLFYRQVTVGGPATKLMPNFFDGMEWVTVKENCPGAMQIVNPMATKTSTGCTRSCKFCAVPKIEGPLVELNDWPDLPIITDNNLLATSERHFDRVMDRLENHRGVDFNQGLDARLLTAQHAERIARLRLAKRGARLSLDNVRQTGPWAQAVETLLAHGVAKRNISSYAIIGFDSDPSEAWRRCEFIESWKVRALPMWFHALDAIEANRVTEEQLALGWTDYERRRIMQWFYQHKKAMK